MEERRAKGLECQHGVKGGLWGSLGFLSLQTPQRRS